MKKSSAGFTVLYILIILLVLGVIGGGIYWTQKINKEPSTDRVVLHLKQLSDIEKIIDPKSSANPNQDETANWKTYTNEKLGFEFKYPKSWNVSNGNNAVEISNGSYHLRFQSFPYPSIDFDKLYEKPDGTIDQNPVFIRTKIKNLEIDGYKATTYSDESTAANQNKSFDISVYIIKGAPITMISGNSDPTSKENFLSIFDQILSTFRFD